MMLDYVEVPMPDGSLISLPRITSLINLFAQYGLVQEYVTKGKTAALEGIAIHDVINRWIGGERIEDIEWWSFPEGVRNAVKAFIRWKIDTGFNPKMSEVTVYSLKHGIGGHLDCIGTINRNITLCDWKSGDIDNERVLLQIAAYGACYLEMYPRRKISGFSAVHLDKKTGGYVSFIVSPADADSYFQKFLKYKAEVGVV